MTTTADRSAPHPALPAESARGATMALGMSTAAFTVCFAAWTIFSILGVQIQKDLGLSETQFGLLVATPILTGSLIRLVLGMWTDQIGGRRVQVLVMFAAAGATWLMTYAHTYPQFLLAALGIGIAGGGFAVGVTYVSKFYPTSRQGTALGIFGAGNIGAAVTKFFAPMVMLALGWEGVARVWALGLVAMAVLFYVTTADEPDLAERRADGLSRITATNGARLMARARVLLSFADQDPGAIIDALAAEVGAERMLFGTDIPFIDPRYTLGRVALANLSEEELRLILGENMARLLP